MMQLKITRQGPAAFAAETRGHRLISDQPARNGGEDLAMTPPELFLASMGTCVGFYVAKFCDARSLPTHDLIIEVTGEILPNPGRIGKIDVSIKLPFKLDPEHSKALIRAGMHCTVHNTLNHTTEVSFRLEDTTA